MNLLCAYIESRGFVGLIAMSLVVVSKTEVGFTSQSCEIMHFVYGFP